MEQLELTPVDVRHKEFSTGLAGYKKEEVREFLELVAHQMEDLQGRCTALAEEKKHLEEARREQEMGWQIGAPVRVDGHLTVVAKDAAGQPLAGAAMELHAIHPLGRAPEQKLQLREISSGLYRSEKALPAGRWKTKVQIRRDGRELDLAFDIQ